MVLLHGFIKKTQRTPEADIELAIKRYKEWHLAKRNPRTGSSFDEFLKQEGVYEEVVAKALKRALAEQLEEGMQSAKLTKVAMARRMSTSRSQLERVLDPQNVSVQLDTLIKAARAVGKTVEIRFKKLAA